jgi:hypothetical protein
MTELLQLPNKDIIGCLLNCSNKGECKYNYLNDNYYCSCFQNYYSGYSCDIDLRKCSNNKLQCLYNGTCNNIINNNNNYDFNCTCKYPYYGRNCQFKQNLCKGITCSNKGVCYNNETTSYYCKCFKGYSGQICEIESNQAKTIKTVNNVSAYFSITFIVIFYASILLLDICHYWKPIKKYFKRIFVKKTKRIVIHEQNDEETVQNEPQIDEQDKIYQEKLRIMKIKMNNAREFSLK